MATPLVSQVKGENADSIVVTGNAHHSRRVGPTVTGTERTGIRSYTTISLDQ